MIVLLRNMLKEFFGTCPRMYFTAGSLVVAPFINHIRSADLVTNVNCFVDVVASCCSHLKDTGTLLPSSL